MITINVVAFVLHLVLAQPTGIVSNDTIAHFHPYLALYTNDIVVMLIDAVVFLTAIRMAYTERPLIILHLIAVILIIKALTLHFLPTTISFESVYTNTTEKYQVILIVQSAFVYFTLLLAFAAKTRNLTSELLMTAQVNSLIHLVTQSSYKQRATGHCIKSLFICNQVTEKFINFFETLILVITVINLIASLIVIGLYLPNYFSFCDHESPFCLKLRNHEIIYVTVVDVLLLIINLFVSSRKCLVRSSLALAFICVTHAMHVFATNQFISFSHLLLVFSHVIIADLTQLYKLRINLFDY